jgi:hypothetical protein
MSSLINPLQAIIDRAAKENSSNSLRIYRERLNANPSGGTVIILDISYSMAETVHGGKRKIDILRDAMNRNISPNEILLIFSSDCRLIYDFSSIPEPYGGTAMHLAILNAAMHKPKHTLIVSDGQPDCKKQALSAAKNLSGIISTLFIGSDEDLEAIAFMSQLANVGCGRSEVCDIRYPQKQNALKSAIAGLLP